MITKLVKLISLNAFRSIFFTKTIKRDPIFLWISFCSLGPTNGHGWRPFAVMRIKSSDISLRSVCHFKPPTILQKSTKNVLIRAYRNENSERN